MAVVDQEQAQVPPPPHPPRHRLSLLLAALAKLACVSQNQLSPPPVLPLTPVTHNLSTLYDPHSHTFTIIDRSNVSLALEPGPGTCSPSTSLVLLVLSALGNTDRRVRLRAEMAEWREVSLVFLVAEARTAEAQAVVAGEQAEHGDLLQVQDPESYDRLAYKTLAGLLWTSLHCPTVSAVAKTDDDVTLDTALLVDMAAAKEGDFLSCTCPSRNFRPNRNMRPESVQAKWVVTWEDLPRRVYPDFCSGWLWVTTPR